MNIDPHLCVAFALCLAGTACKPDADGAGASSAPATAAPASTTARGATAGAGTGASATTPPATAGKLLGSCMIMNVACSDYYGASSPDTVKKVCESVGKWSDGACPSSGIQGTCTKAEPGGVTSKSHTYPPGTRATAKQACDNTPGGVFSG